ncbi:hypothetical protein scyTo_0018915, partial [Scyliorhinus torazame]|nr:hypothetical protein [Scyliorhinus torazame]
MPALDWGEHSKKSYNTRLKSNRFVSMSLAFGALLLPQ